MCNPYKFVLLDTLNFLLTISYKPMYSKNP